MRPFAASLAILTACAFHGCAPEEEEHNRAASMTPAQLYREIEAVRELKPEDDPDFPVVLQTGDWKEEHGEPACSFVQPGGVTLLANRSHASLRLKRGVVALKAAGPVDETAGFFAAPSVTMSVAVLEDQASEAGASRMAVRVAAEKKPSMHEGKWICS